MTRKLTKTEIRKLTDAGISFKVDGREVIVAVPYEGEIRDGLTGADVDSVETARHVRKACKIVPTLDGFSTGWGGWHLRKGYENVTRGWDFNNPASPHHY